MVEDRPEDGAPAEPSRPRREPPTIDLKATDVSEAPKAEVKEAEAKEAEAKEAEVKKADAAATEPAPEAAAPFEAAAPAQPDSPQTIPPKPISPWAIAPISGAVAASLVIGVGWMLGWPAVQAPAPAPKFNAAAIDDLAARVAGLEAKTGKPVAPVADPATAARLEAIEKSVTALRGDLGATRAQAEKLASAVAVINAQPRGDGAAPAPAPAPIDLSPLEERLAQLERAAKAQATEIAAIKAAEAKPADTKPADDVALRRLVAASLLDLSVRHGEGFVSQLAAAKSLAPGADTLKPLEAFAASGVPSAAALCRDLVAIVPKLAPSAPEAETTGSGIMDRLQAGASKLVRIQRADATGTDRASVVARVTAAALRNDLAEARRELSTMAPADRAAAQAWLDRADGRDAALAASRKFASDATAALATAR